MPIGAKALFNRADCLNPPGLFFMSAMAEIQPEQIGTGPGQRFNDLFS